MTTTSLIPNVPTYHLSSLTYELQFFDDIMAEAGFFADEDMMLPQPETEEFMLPAPTTVPEPYKCVSPPYSPNHPVTYSQPQTGMVDFGSPSPTSVHEMLNPHDLRYAVPQQQHHLLYAPNQAPLLLPSAPSLIYTVEPTPINTGNEERAHMITPKKVASTTTPCKRRLSCTSSSSGSAIKHRNYTPKQQVDRRERNRQHAKKSRNRKKSFTDELLISLQEIRDENQKLRTELNDRCGKDLIDSMILSKVGEPNEKFSAALKKRENCLISASTLAMLQAMAKEAMCTTKSF